MEHRKWECNICHAVNTFPAVYANSSAVPPETDSTHTTIEYVLPGQPMPPSFVFLVDTCMRPSELQELKQSIQFSLTQLPQDALVAFITFGTTVRSRPPRCSSFALVQPLLAFHLLWRSSALSLLASQSFRPLACLLSLCCALCLPW